MATLGTPIRPDVAYETVTVGSSTWEQPADWQEENRWMDDQLANQPDTGIDGYIIRFPVADGFAFYKVASSRPLVLRHIEYGDAYRIPGAHIRGLTRADIERQVDYERSMAALFSR